MRKILKKIGVSALALLILFSSFVGNSFGMPMARAEGNVISNITVTKDQVRQAESFGVQVSFGGNGTKVQANQTERIDFSLDKTKIIFSPDTPIQLIDDVSKQNLGTVHFEGNSAILTFNETAAQLEDVRGQFYFNVFAYWSGDQSEPGQGSIDVSGGNIHHRIIFKHEIGGTTTGNIYDKKGIWLNQGNKVDWVFNFNSARKPSNGGLRFFVEDYLPETMEWDQAENTTKPHVVEIDGQWYPWSQAQALGIYIFVTGQKLTIDITGDGYGNLEQRKVAVRLTAKIKDNIMQDLTQTSVTNKSEAPNITGITGDIDVEDSVEIIRSGGWATGTVRGELKILKFTKDKQIPIPGVQFILQRKDGTPFTIKTDQQGESAAVSTHTLTTNEQGIANVKGLSSATYIVKESSAPNWIKFNPSNPISHTFTVFDHDAYGHEFKIANEKKTTSVTVTKEWSDTTASATIASAWGGIPSNHFMFRSVPFNLNTSGDHPTVKVQLYRDDQPVQDAGIVNPVSISATEHWMHTWTGLPETDDQGKPYTYSVKELGDDGQAVEGGGRITLNGVPYSVLLIGPLPISSSDMDDTKDISFVITNTKQEPRKGQLIVTKLWQDYKKDGINAPVHEIEVQLYKNDQKVNGRLEKLNSTNQWTAVFNDLEFSGPSNSLDEYTVKEIINGKEIAPGEEVIIDGVRYMSSLSTPDADSQDVGIKRINLNNAKQEPDKTQVTVKKEWVNQDPENVQPVTVRLYKNNQRTEQTKTLNKDNGWTDTFTDLDQLEQGTPIIYTVQEDGVVGSQITQGEKTYQVDIIKNGESGFSYTIKNTLVNPKISIQGKKEWVDAQDQDGKRPPEVTIHLYADNAEVHQETKATKENGWNYQFNHLDTYNDKGEKIIYRVKEVQVPVGYQSKVENFNITNTHQPEEVNIKVEKTWDDKGNTQRPKTVKVSLYSKSVDDQVEKLVREATLQADAQGFWKHDFGKFPKYKNGVEIAYSVKEEVPNGYSVIYDGNVKDGFKIKNTLDQPLIPIQPSTVDIEVVKEWKYQGETDPKAPISSILVQLYKDGVKQEGMTKELKAAEGWRASFSGLAHHEKVANGIRVHVYTVKEVYNGRDLEHGDVTSMAGRSFKVDIQGNAQKGFKIINKERPSLTPIEPMKKLKVTKQWQDHKGQDISSKAPVEQIKVQLYKDKVKQEGAVKTLNKANGWTATFTGLKGNHQYAIKEVDENNGTITLSGETYHVTYRGSMKDGFVVVNTKQPPHYPPTPPYTWTTRSITPLPTPKPNPPKKEDVPPSKKEPEVSKANEQEQRAPSSVTTPKEKESIKKQDKSIPKTGLPVYPISYTDLLVCVSGSMFLFTFRRKGDNEE